MNQMIEPYPELSLFNQNLQEIIEISLPEGIPYLGFGQDGVIRTPVGPINSFFTARTSPLPNEAIPQDKLKNFFGNLDAHSSIIRFNHLGVCYKVDSQEEEKERLSRILNGSGQYLYEEPSNDLGLWLFIGDTSNWENPLFELVPVEDTSDKWVDYWLPHVQIDLDTKLDAKSIEKLSKEHFGNDILPYQVTVIDGIVYAVRLRLGVIDGVNINLDLGTNNRNTKYVRENLLRRV